MTFEQGEDGSSKLGLAQYKLANWSHSEVYRNHQKVRANVSVISLHFAFHRQTGFYLLQIYVPLTLIVMCSWVTFWLRKTEKGQTGLRSTLLSLILLLGANVSNGILYREENKGLYVVARSFFLLLLNCSTWPCLGTA